MHKYFKQSIKGAVGSLTYKVINTRNMLIFVKVNSYKVNCYLSAYSTIESEHSLSLTNEYIEINDCSANYRMQYIISSQLRGNSYRSAQVGGMQTIPNISLNWLRSGWIYTLADGSKTVPYKGLKLTYDGHRYMAKHPNKYIKETKDLLDTAKSQRNAQARARYHNNRAEERLERSRVFYKRELTEEERKKNPNLDYKIDMAYAVDTVPMTDIFKLWNVSQRRILIDHYGMDNVISTLDSKVVDKDVVKGNPYELVVVQIPDKSRVTGLRKATYLRMINPSTGETHFEGVPNVITRDMDRWERRRALKKQTVLCALAWRNQDDVYMAPEIIT